MSIFVVDYDDGDDDDSLPEYGGRFRQHCISSFLGATLLSGRKAKLESLPLKNISIGN